MKRRNLLFALLSLALVGGVAAQADEAEPAPPITTTPSQIYPQVTCTSSNAGVCADVLQIAVDTREQLAPLLKLGNVWRFPVHIHVIAPDDPLAAKINREAAAVFAQGTSMRIEAVFPSSDLEGRIFIQRQFVTALLWEKFFATTQTFDKHTPLTVVPLWLVEGLREWMNEDPERDRESIVRRAVQSQRAPSLTEITAWHELSRDRLLGLWQRAFCFYLVNSLIREQDKRADFQQWLDSYAGPNPSTALLLFPTETAWQHELVDATNRSRNIVYTWNETSDELTSGETLTIATSKNSKVQSCKLDNAAMLPHDKIVIEALQQKIFLLTALELRAHPSWRPILEQYRFGLTALMNDKDPSQARKLLAEAGKLRATEVDYHQKLIDYINWFEVTKDFPTDTARFRAYFDTAEEMEKMQADPKHPNPIRANLLQIESEL